MSYSRSAIIGLSVIGVVALAALVGAFVLFSISYFLCAASFALSVILFYVIYSEVNYRKGNDLVLKDTTTPRETVISLNKSWIIFRAIGYAILIALGFYFIYLTIDKSGKINLREDYFLLALGAFFIIAASLSLYKTVTSKRKIIINNQGINYDSKNLIPWRDITNECVIVKIKTTGGKYPTKYEAYYLSFKNKRELIELCLEDYDTTDKQVAQLLQIYRSRFSS